MSMYFWRLVEEIDWSARRWRIREGLAPRTICYWSSIVEGEAADAALLHESSEEEERRNPLVDLLLTLRFGSAQQRGEALPRSLTIDPGEVIVHPPLNLRALVRAYQGGGDIVWGYEPGKFFAWLDLPPGGGRIIVPRCWRETPAEFVERVDRIRVRRQRPARVLIGNLVRGLDVYWLRPSGRSTSGRRLRRQFPQGGRNPLS